MLYRSITRFTSIKYGSDLLHNQINIYRNSYLDTLNNSFNIALPLHQYKTPYNFNSFTRTYKYKITARHNYDCSYKIKLKGIFDAVRDSLIEKISIRYNQKIIYNTQVNFNRDTIQYIIRAGNYCNNYDSFLSVYECIKNKYDSIANFTNTTLKFNFKICHSYSKFIMRNRFDFLRYLTKNCVRGINHILTLNHLCIPNRNNSVVAYSELQTTRNLILYNYDLLTQNSCLGSSKFDSVILSLPHHQNKSFFDVCGIGRALFKFAHQAFVKSGWRIIVRNILTNEKIDLGFIDADSNEHLLTDISLPNGDYEISVLTSSLFWQDAIDRKIRTFSTNENNNLSLPLIYDLRSLISNNITIIQWSTNQTAIDNCIFGIWYSPTSPVDINRQPDANILYKISQTEYQILLNQNKPLYILVAAMYASDKPIIGNTHELFLNWNSIPPRAPDDVVVLN